MISFLALKGKHCCLLILIIQLGILTDAQVTVESPNHGCVHGSVLRLNATDTPQTIQSPNYPSSYGNNEDCSWLISAPQGVISLTVQYYDIEAIPSCLYDGLRIDDGPSMNEPCNLTLCGTSDFSEEYVTSSNETFVTFYSDSSEVGGGFILTFQNVDGNISSTIPCESAGNGSSSRNRSSSGFHNEWCNYEYLEATSTPQTIYSPNYPQPYEADLHCTWSIHAHQGVIKITVTYDIEYSHGCAYDCLSIYDPSPSSNCYVVLCDQALTPEEYITSTDYAEIHFNTYSSSTASGFALTYQYVDETVAPTVPCGESEPSHPTAGRCPLATVHLNATLYPQIIESPNYPGPAYGDSDCYWKISAPYGVIKITIDNYHIQAGGESCAFDSLTIFDGPSSYSGCNVKLCGRSLDPNEYITSSNEVFVHFHTDSHTTFGGFSLAYEYMDVIPSPRVECPQLNLAAAPSRPSRCENDTVLLNATSTPQTIQSSNYPFNYTNNQDCLWKISAPQGVVSITVQHYDIEYSPVDCDSDSLNIYDGPSSGSACWVTLCGSSSSPEEYITSSEEAFIHFHTDFSATEPGFTLTYQYVDSDTASSIPCAGSSLHWPMTN